MRGEMFKSDRRIDPPIGIEDWRAEPIEMEPAATLPTHCGRNPALFTVDHFAKARYAMGDGMVSHFNPDVAPPHLMCDGSGCAGAEVGIKHKVTLICGE